MVVSSQGIFTESHKYLTGHLKYDRITKYPLTPLVIGGLVVGNKHYLHNPLADSQIRFGNEI
ncbi:hypothetical protein GMMP15_560060 [Candidatus Magnetomoraceae bacterium gMMP-15]